MIYFNRFETDKDILYRILKIISLALIILSTGIFVYFFTLMNFKLHYFIVTGCFWIMFTGILILFHGYLNITEKSVELTFEKVHKHIKKLYWLSIGALYCSGLCFSGGLIIIAVKNGLWHYAILFFTGSILSFMIIIYCLIQRKITKQHYELKKQNQEILELLSRFIKNT